QIRRRLLRRSGWRRSGRLRVRSATSRRLHMRISYAHEVGAASRYHGAARNNARSSPAGSVSTGTLQLPPAAASPGTGWPFAAIAIRSWCHMYHAGPPRAGARVAPQRDEDLDLAPQDGSFLVAAQRGVGVRSVATLRDLALDDRGHFVSAQHAPWHLAR